jgi:hydroxypyruvate isomerase
MPRFAANLHYLFNEVPFLERFAAAAHAGFQGVEWPAAELSSLLREHRLELALIDTPQGDWDAGERGLAALPGREPEFRAGVQRAAEYAKVMRAGAVHLIAGVVPPETDLEAAKATYLENLKYGAEILGQRGIAAVIEPINPLQGDIDGGETYTTYGMRGFYLTRTEQALRAIEAVSHPNLYLHLDFYHMQLTEGRLADTITRHIRRIKHLQIAGVPGRNEPSRARQSFRAAACSPWFASIPRNYAIRVRVVTHYACRELCRRCVAHDPSSVGLINADFIAMEDVYFGREFARIVERRLNSQNERFGKSAHGATRTLT